MAVPKLNFKRGEHRQLDRPTAIVCLLINAFVLPGSGTLYAGRWTGYPQMGITLPGAGMTLWFIIGYFKALADAGGFTINPGRLLDAMLAVSESFHGDNRHLLWMGIIGLALVIAGWAWSVLSGFLLIRDAKKPGV